MATQPDYHLMYIDSTLGAEWLFSAARRYWDRYRPIIVSNLEVIALIPPKNTLTITILARRDIAPKIIDDISKRFPRAGRDPLVYDVPADLKLTLDGRVDYNQRFGVPEDAPAKK